MALRERGRRKSAADPEMRLGDVIRAHRNRVSKRAGQAVLDELESSDLDQHKEIELLTKILNENRQRQGISAPKDG